MRRLVTASCPGSRQAHQRCFWTSWWAVGIWLQSQGRFPVVGLGPRADEALDPLRTGEFAFTVKKRASKSRSASRARRAVDLVREEAALDARPRVGDDAELFEELRDLRRELADEHQVPAYIICSDATLRGLCRRRPPARRSCSRSRASVRRRPMHMGRRS